MKVVNDTLRYKILAEQLTLKPFSVDISKGYYKKMEHSLNRLFWYVYSHSDILYIEFINEKILVQYIKFQRESGFQELTFTEAIQDVKHFIAFLEKFKKLKRIPKIDLSVNNSSLWDDL